MCCGVRTVLSKHNGEAQSVPVLWESVKDRGEQP